MNMIFVIILISLLGYEDGLARSIFNDNSYSTGNQFITGYYAARAELIRAENEFMTGAFTSLNELESKVDDMFMKHKMDELNWGENNTDFHAAGLHFFRAKDIIERSKVFRFLQKMPKGAILHLHDSSSVSSKWIVGNMSYIPGLLRCTNKDGVSILSFRTSPTHGCATRYVSVSAERRAAYNYMSYDFHFEKLINLYTPNPETDYPSIDRVWVKFANMFTTMQDAITYLDVFRLYIWQMLKEMYDDNVMYAEVRSLLLELYDSNGRTYGPERTVWEIIDVVNKFREQNPKFLGIKVIMSANRRSDINTMKQKLHEFQQLQSKFPDFIVGFDISSQENKGNPLTHFIELFLQSPKTTYFFHAGETNEFGKTDSNLYDAVLLNTKRIGHGYMLMKHPLLRQIVKRRQIAVEVNPISNQVLHLTADLRNHPGGIFLSEDIPMVISNDDPSAWNVKGLSYDFYYAIMSFVPKQSGLKVLKTLALNSLKYSALNKSELSIAISLWERDWRAFLIDALNGNVF